MVHKVIISFLLVGLVISLVSGLVFLFKDVGSTRRTLNSLGVRVALAAAIVGTIFHGFYTGNLGVGAPWDARKFEQLSAQSTPGTGPDAATIEKQPDSATVAETGEQVPDDK